MAVNDPKIVMIVGAGSATLATAVTNYNTAVQTLLTNNPVVWNAGPTYPPGTGATPQCIHSGLVTQPGATTAEGFYIGWGVFQYLSAS